MRRIVNADSHRPESRWPAIRAAYAEEPEAEPARSAALALLEQAAKVPVTRLYAARDEVHDNAVALKLWLESRA